jgi:hypothetical protein
VEERVDKKLKKGETVGGKQRLESSLSIHQHNKTEMMLEEERIKIILRVCSVTFS